MAHIAVVMLSTITLLGLAEEWFMCYFYIVYHYSLRFERGVVHVLVVILSTITV